MPAAATTSVLITRPQPFAGELAAVIRSQGLDPVMLDILATKTAGNPQQLGRQIKSLLPAKQAIFTSRSAVTHTFQILDPADFNGSGIAAMGAGTARELRMHGFASVLLPADGTNSEDLLQLEQFSANNAGTAIIFCAPHGRGVLQRELGERGWRVRNAETYERIIQAPKASMLSDIRAAKQLICVFTSGTAIEACAEQLPADIWQRMLTQPWLVISNRLEALARKAGADAIYETSGPDNNAISEAIRGILVQYAG